MSELLDMQESTRSLRHSGRDRVNMTGQCADRYREAESSALGDRDPGRIAEKFRADLAALPGPIARKAAVFAWAVVVPNDAFSEKGPPDEVRATCNGIRDSRRHVGMALAGEVDSFGDR
jgi:hypothetical protein